MSGFNDPYSQILGSDSPYDQAAVNYYGNMPQLRMPYLAGGGYDPQVDFQNRVRSAFQADVISRVNQIDPTADDYEIQVNELLSGIPDTSAYPQLETAISSNLGRRKILQEKRQQEIASQVSLAKLGLSPGEISQIKDEKGQFDPVRAAYKEYQLKSGKPAERMPISEKERESMLPLITQMRQGTYTDDDKALALAKATGTPVDPEMDPEGFSAFKESLTPDQWKQAHQVRQQEVQGQVNSLIEVLDATGRDVKGLRALIGGATPAIDPWEATRSPGSPAPAVTEPSAPGTNQPKPDSAGYTDPTDPNISMLEADKARQDQAKTQAESAQKADTNQQWTQGKQALERRLLGVFDNDPNKLRQFYNSVQKNEFTSSGDGVNAPMMAENLAETILKKVGVNPGDVSDDIGLDRGIFGGGKVSNLDLLKSLASDRLNQSTTQPNELKTKSGNVARPSSSK